MEVVEWEGGVKWEMRRELSTQLKGPEWWQQPERRIDIDMKGMRRWMCSGASACWLGVVTSAAL